MLSIVITHHKTPVMLKLCLKAIKNCLGSFEHEILVADCEADTDAQQPIKEAFPQVKFLSFPKNVGYAKLVNEGLKDVLGEYILILNADIIILPGSIQKMIKFLKETPEAGIVGPRLLAFNGKPQDSCFRFPTLGAILARRTFVGKLEWGKRQLNKFLYRDKDFSLPASSGLRGTSPTSSRQAGLRETSWQRVDWLQGSAMLGRREIIDKIGSFDERFFMYLEDTDWCKRFWQNGFQVIYYPGAKVHHYHYRNSRKWGGILDILLNKFTRIHLVSTVKYFLKYR